MAEFFPVDENMSKNYNEALDNGRVALHCLDWNDDDLSIASDGAKEL